MNINLPKTSAIKKSLEQLGHSEMQGLAAISGVPFTTLWKIRAGITQNPGIETVRGFYLHIPRKTKTQRKTA